MVKENRLIFATAAVLAAKKKREATIAAAKAANPEKFKKTYSGNSGAQGYGDAKTANFLVNDKANRAAFGATLTPEALKKPPVNQTPNKPASASSTSQWNGTSWAEPDNAMSTPVPSISSSSNPVGGAKADSAGNYSYTLNGQTVSVTPDEVAKYGSIAKAGNTKFGSDTIFDEEKPPPADIDEAMEEKVADEEMTAEEQAAKDREDQEARIEAEYHKNWQAAQDLVDKGVLDVNPYPSTYEDYLKRKGTRDDADMAYLQGQNAIGSELDKAALDRSTSQGKAAVDASTAAMAQSREGAMGTSAPMVAREFKAETDKLIHENELRFKSAEDARNEAERKMKQAQDDGDEEMAAIYSGQLSQAKQDMLAAEVQQAKLGESAANTALTFAQVEAAEANTQSTHIKNMTTLFSNMTPTDLEKMTKDQLMAYSSTYNLDYGTVANLQAQAVITNKMATATDQAELDKLNQDLSKLQAESSTWGKTDEAVAWEYYSGLTDTQKQQYNAWRAENSDGKIQMIDGKPYSYNSTTQSLTALPFDDGESLQGPWGGVNDALSVPDGAPTDPTTGKPAVDSWNGKSGSIQCAQFVNRYTGLGMGNSYSSKVNALQSISVDTPQAGDVFVSPYTTGGEDIGHAGFVVGVNSDGTVTVKDANYDGKTGQISTHTMSTNGMKFGRPGKQKGLDTGTVEGQLVTKYETQGKNSGLKGQELKDFVSDRVSDSYKSMTEAQGKAYNAYTMMSNENEFYDGLVEGVDMQEFSDAINTVTRKATEAGTSVTGDLINKFVVDDNIRQAMMSEFRWLEGALREESGAAITPAEYSTKGTAFFPRFGDDAGTLEQKRKARLLSTEGKMSKAGPAAERMFLEANAAIVESNKDVELYAQSYTNSLYLPESTDQVAW
jgi:hypothetical protein